MATNTSDGGDGTTTEQSKRGTKTKEKKEKKAQATKKKDTKPAFLMPTASGRTPKVATRYEAADPSTSEKNNAASGDGQSSNKRQKTETTTTTPSDSPSTSSSKMSIKDPKALSPNSFEKTVVDLERHLKMIPQKNPPPTQSTQIKAEPKKVKVEAQEEVEENANNEESESEDEEQASVLSFYHFGRYIIVLYTNFRCN